MRRKQLQKEEFFNVIDRPIRRALGATTKQSKVAKENFLCQPRYFLSVSISGLGVKFLEISPIEAEKMKGLTDCDFNWCIVKKDVS
jgi:hypothetical protein